MKITANILTADQPTVNGRVYTKAVLEGIVKQLEGKEILGTVVYDGMKDYQYEYGEVDRVKIDLNRVSHKCENVRIEGDCLIADAIILDTPIGKIAKELIMAGDQVPVRFIPAGVGQCKEGIVSDYTISSIDITPN